MDINRHIGSAPFIDTKPITAEQIYLDRGVEQTISAEATQVPFSIIEQLQMKSGKLVNRGFKVGAGNAAKFADLIVGTTTTGKITRGVILNGVGIAYPPLAPVTGPISATLIGGGVTQYYNE